MSTSEIKREVIDIMQRLNEMLPTAAVVNFTDEEREATIYSLGKLSTPKGPATTAQSILKNLKSYLRQDEEG